MNLKDISHKFRAERQVKAVTGLTVEQFFIILAVFEKHLLAQKEVNKANKIKPTNGKKGILLTASDKLLFIFFYLKCYPTFDLLGFTFDMSGSSAYTWLSKLMPSFVKTLADFNVLPQTAFKTPEDMINAFKGIDTLLIDATERAIQRPQDYDVQEDHYSGKKTDTLSRTPSLPL